MQRFTPAPKEWRRAVRISTVTALKSCLFAGPGELPHTGSRAVVFSRRPGRADHRLMRNPCVPHPLPRLNPLSAPRVREAVEPAAWQRLAPVDTPSSDQDRGVTWGERLGAIAIPNDWCARQRTRDMDGARGSRRRPLVDEATDDTSRASAWSAMGGSETCDAANVAPAQAGRRSSER